MGPETGHMRTTRSPARWLGALAVACVLLAVLWSAAAANASSRRWTVVNHSFVPLKLISIKQYEDKPFELEGQPAIGAELAPAFDRPWSTTGHPTEQHIELGYGANVEALVKYQVVHFPNDYLEFWIGNFLDFPDARCRFIHNGHIGQWSLQAELFGNDSDLDIFRCRAGSKLFSRTVQFADQFHGFG
jgi:hypothetical protein